MQMQASATTLSKPVHTRKRRHELKAVAEIETAGKWRANTPQTASRIAKESPERVRWRVTTYQNGKRRRLFFATEKEAKGKLEELAIRQKNLGTRAGNLSGKEIEDAAESLKLLAPHGLSILDAAREAANLAGVLKPFDVSPVDVVRDYIARREEAEKSLSISALVAEFIAEREAKGMSAYYLRDLRVRLGKFAEEFGERMASDLGPKEIDAWASGLPVAARTVGNYLRCVAAMFTFAVKRGYSEKNPAAAVDKPKTASGPPEIFTPTQVEKLLAVADPAITPWLAIGFFAGLRPEELKWLNWGEIDLEAGYVEVTAANCKTAKRRLVEISDNLRAWLEAYRQVAGPVAPPNARKRRLKAMEAARIDRWPVDVMRHSFCSYHLAAHNDAAKTALRAGHSTTKMLFEYYREVVKPKAAEAFWAILPKAEPEDSKIVRIA